MKQKLLSTTKRYKLNQKILDIVAKELELKKGNITYLKVECNVDNTTDIEVKLNL